jgi:uncharacterized protein YxjI
MRYVMKQKLFCWGDDFAISNEAARTAAVPHLCLSVSIRG